MDVDPIIDTSITLPCIPTFVIIPPCDNIRERRDGHILRLYIGDAGGGFFLEQMRSVVCFLE